MWASTHPSISSRWAPTYVWTLPTHVDPSLLAPMNASVDSLLNTAEYPIGFVIDLSSVATFNAAAREAHAHARGRRVALAARKILAQAVVCQNPRQRGFVTATSWMTPPPYPIVFCSTVDEGILYCEQQLQKYTRKVPDAERSRHPGRPLPTVGA